MAVRNHQGLIPYFSEITIRVLVFGTFFVGLALLVSLLGLTGDSKAGLLLGSGLVVIAATWASDYIECRVRARLARRENLPPREFIPPSWEWEHGIRGLTTSALRHDINGQLAVIRVSLELLDREVRDDRFRDLIQRAIESVERLASLVYRVTEVAALGGGEIESVEFNDLIKQVIELKGRELKGSQIALVTKVSDQLPRIRGNKLLILEAILNVVQNAIDAMEGTLGPKVLTVVSSETPETVTVEVKDSGPGIGAEIRQDLFRRPISTKEGMGLGLLLTSNIVELHGGSISFDSVPGEGTVFRFEFPVSPTPGSRVPSREGKRKSRILIVDDELSVVNLLLPKLTSKGYDTDVATTLDAAWGKIHERAYDAILLDLVMPSSLPGVQNGLDLVQCLRSEESDIGSKVIFVTAFRDMLSEVDTLAPGSKVVSKPFTVDEIFDVLPSVH
jgi:signal transduction histidine kinase/ActR/RegA family two-component response regulator